MEQKVRELKIFCKAKRCQMWDDGEWCISFCIQCPNCVVSLEGEYGPKRYK